jgi:hypothetical protein
LKKVQNTLQYKYILLRPNDQYSWPFLLQWNSNQQYKHSKIFITSIIIYINKTQKLLYKPREIFIPPADLRQISVNEKNRLCIPHIPGAINEIESILLSTRALCGLIKILSGSPSHTIFPEIRLRSTTFPLFSNN